ncbi:MAG: hypothetical protein QM702_02660 [Rubrivivax sp.]
MAHHPLVRIHPNRCKQAKALPATPRTWAERHAPLAQVIAAYSTLAAVVVAGLGFWFTVIPLYQKAAVDEQLAKREAELKQLDSELARARREAYELVRSGLLEQTAIRASFDCAGFFRDGGATAIDRLSEPLASCILKASGSIVEAKRLTEGDSQTLMRESERFVAEWEQRRLATLEKVKEIPSRASIDSTILAEEGPHSKRVTDYLTKIEPYLSEADRQRQRQRQFERRVRQTQYQMALNFGTELSTAMLKFYRAGIWPAVKLTAQ